MPFKKTLFVVLPLLAIALLVGGVYMLARPDERLDVQAQLSVSQALASNSSGFARVLEPRPFSFPQDHGPHPEYGIEWWYFTGNLDTPQGRHFGFELTFFRVGLSPEVADRDSEWAASQIYTAHFGLTDVESNRFYSFERFSRVSLGLAGADTDAFRVWLEDWSAESVGGDTLPIHLQASESDVAIDLALNSAKPIVLQGDEGFSRKSGDEGNASYYYSMTRMPTSGTVRIGDEAFEVSGASWMDREWSTSALADEQVGWDWFALQLDDGREVMYYQLRLQDGGIDDFSSGTVVMQDGSTHPLTPEDIQIDVADMWQSDLGGEYPSEWRMRIPSEGLEIKIMPYISNQEMNVSVRYWEGAVSVEGTSSDGQAISGNGYIEMTGYSGKAGGRS